MWLISVHFLVQAEWAAESVWMGRENLAATWIRSPDRAARNDSLYRPIYSDPLTDLKHHIIPYAGG